MTLTQGDFNEMEELVREVVKDEIKNMPTKDEFFEKMDEVMGELKTIREEQVVMGGHVSEGADKIEELEIHPQGKHAFV